MSYKQILTTNDIGAEANQVAAGNHNHDSNYVKKSGDTMTGLLKVTNAPIFSYVYASNKNFPAYVFDKPGSYLTGIGSRNNSDEIYFGAVDTSDYKWIDDYQQKWTFNGSVNAANGFTSDDSCYLILQGLNEINLKTSYTDNSNIWLNFRTPSGGATKDTLIFGNGTSGGLGIIKAAQFNGNVIMPGLSTTWVAGRDSAVVKISSYSGYNAITSMKTTNGSWENGVYTNDRMYFNYVPDSNYNAGTNQAAQIWLGPDASLHASAVWGAVWNDYAECHEADTIEPGKCVIEVGNDTLTTSTERLIPGANITSDTFGFSIGETEQAKTPIAVSGRVLAYPYESREEFKKNIGRPVCSGPNGTVSIMTDEEYRDKGYCAIGTISAVPDYEEWGTGKVKVNGRVWIKVF